MAHTERHPPKEIGRARPIFFWHCTADVSDAPFYFVLGNPQSRMPRGLPIIADFALFLSWGYSEIENSLSRCGNWLSFIESFMRQTHHTNPVKNVDKMSITKWIICKNIDFWKLPSWKQVNFCWVGQQLLRIVSRRSTYGEPERVWTIVLILQTYSTLQETWTKADVPTTI